MSSLRVPAALFTALFLGCMLQSCGSSPFAQFLGDREVRAETLKPDGQRHMAPDFALKDADGKTVHLADYRGKVVLLDFWATWCGPCKIEIPWFMDIQRKDKDRGFEVLGVSMDDEGWEVVKPFLSELKVNYRVVMGTEETSQLYGGIEALPTTFVIDREGKIASVHVGLSGKKEFEDDVEQLLDAPTKPPATGAVVPALSLFAK